jgi:hypothetical protein
MNTLLSFFKNNSVIPELKGGGGGEKKKKRKKERRSDFSGFQNEALGKRFTVYFMCHIYPQETWQNQMHVVPLPIITE